MSNNAGIIIAAFLLSGAYLSGQYFSNERKPSKCVALSPMTASELFHIRSDCRELGQKLLDEQPVSPTLSRFFLADYNETDNRCYIKLEASSADDTTDNIDFYDGQTNQALAMWHTTNGQTSAFIFDKLRNGQATTVSDVMDYINEKMEGVQ